MAGIALNFELQNYSGCFIPHKATSCMLLQPEYQKMYSIQETKVDHAAFFGGDRNRLMQDILFVLAGLSSLQKLSGKVK